MTQLALSLATLLSVAEVDAISRARTDAYVRLMSAGWNAMPSNQPRPLDEVKHARLRAVVDEARTAFAAAADAWDAVDESSRERWAAWVNGGRK